MMRAISYARPEHFELINLPVPEPVAGQALLRLLAAGVCGTDLHLHRGEFGPTYPLTPGHEFVGEVVAVGDQVQAGLVGHRVVVDNTASCGRCVDCRRARPAFCRNLVAQGVNAPGGFAEYVITDADRCFVVDDLEPLVAVLAEPVACVIHGLDVLELKPGADVLLFGAGPTGLILTSLLASSGAGRLTVAAPTQIKLDLARSRGADRVVRLDRDDPHGSGALLAEMAPDGFDVVIDATGSPLLGETVGLTRTGGTIFVYGMAREDLRWPVSPYEIFRRELTIKGSFAQQFSFDRALLALRSGRVVGEGVVSHTFDLDHYRQALDAVADPNVIKAALVP